MINWLVYTNIIIWILLCSYVCFIGYKQIRLEKRLKKMEYLDNE
ncbi:CcmD family protein [Lawsonia intracellularis]|nr:CcmD family protein [Lawsonia intracellularis]MBZ3892827.1 CcmD family protein [Lawsonia intracellularis]UYH52689.1 CcmD family protein [Lawsonia intracellularis]